MASLVVAGDSSGSVTLAAPAVAGTTTLTLPTTSGTLVVTGGAQTVQFAAGSAASPSITFTGDTNTGIFSPAADTIAFTEGGVESLRINSSGNAIFAQTANLPNTFGFKNRIINGAMVIDQRNAGASVTPSVLFSTYTLDRWVAIYSTGSKFSVQQNAGSVTPPTGFTNYLGVTSLSSYSVPSGEGYIISQMIEGFNVADLGWGTANAQTITISFWVRSSLTGTFSGALSNGAENRSYAFTYTISSANTWEQKSVTIAGDTTGTWLTNNGIGLRLKMGLGAAGALAGTAGSWAAANYYGATGATSVVGTNGATFYTTGWQLEVGSTATSFDYRPYGTELALCQRYFQANGASGGNNTVTVGQASGSGTATSAYVLPVVMRTTPVLTIPAGATWGFLTANLGSSAGGTISIAGSSNNQVINFNLSGGSGLTAGNATSLVVSFHGYQLSAEL